MLNRFLRVMTVPRTTVPVLPSPQSIVAIKSKMLAFGRALVNLGNDAGERPPGLGAAAAPGQRAARCAIAMTTASPWPLEVWSYALHRLWQVRRR